MVKRRVDLYAKINQLPLIKVQQGHLYIEIRSVTGHLQKLCPDLGVLADSCEF